MKTHMIRCNSKFRAYALIRQIFTPLYTNVYWALFSSVYYNFSWLLNYCLIYLVLQSTPAYVNEVAGYSEFAPLIDLFQLRNAQNVVQNLCLSYPGPISEWAKDRHWSLGGAKF